MICFVEIDVSGFGEFELVFDSVESGVDHKRECEIRIRKRIGGSQLSSSVFAESGGNAYELGAVLRGPGDVSGSFIASESLV